MPDLGPMNDSIRELTDKLECIEIKQPGFYSTSAPVAASIGPNGFCTISDEDDHVDKPRKLGYKLMDSDDQEQKKADSAPPPATESAPAPPYGLLEVKTRPRDALREAVF